MAEIELRAGAKINLLNKEELDQSLGNFMQPLGSLRATDGIRLPVLIKAAANPFTMGGDSGTLVQGPDQGYVWSLRHLVVEGLTTGATPDVVNILSRNRVIWQLNGNQFAQTFGRGEIIIRSGETIGYQSVGTFAATGQIIAHGLAEQVPQELEGRFYV
jgi:hypothetical protein